MQFVDIYIRKDHQKIVYMLYKDGNFIIFSFNKFIILHHEKIF